MLFKFAIMTHNAEVDFFGEKWTCEWLDERLIGKEELIAENDIRIIIHKGRETDYVSIRDIKKLK